MKIIYQITFISALLFASVAYAEIRNLPPWAAMVLIGSTLIKHNVKRSLPSC